MNRHPLRAQTLVSLVVMAFVTLLCFARETRAQTVDSSDTAAREMIRSIWTASEIYYQDKGQWPDSLNVLITKKYLEMPVEILKHWRFELRAGGPPSSIRAISLTKTYRDDGDDTTRFPEMIFYDVHAAKWGGYGFADSKQAKRSADQQADLAEPAIAVVNAIWESAQIYYQDKGQWPETPEVLNQESYVQLTAGLQAQWQFGFLGSPPQRVVAISTNDMPDGAGRTLALDVATNTWQGYGLSKLKHALDSSAVPHVIYAKKKAK